MRFSHLTSVAAASLIFGNCSIAQDMIAKIGPDSLQFSVENMDPTVDPADDFYRYAAGGWLGRVKRPEGKAQVSFATIITARIDAQLKPLIAGIVANVGTAGKGSPEQQIGTLYLAYMDVETANAAGLAPIQGELDRIGAIKTKEDLARYLGYFSTISGQWPLIEIEVTEGFDDGKTAQVYIQPATAGLSVAAVLEAPRDSAVKQVYADYIQAMLRIAGYKTDRLAQIAQTSIAIESDLHAGKMAPELKVDFRKWNNPRTYDALQAEMPEVPFAAFLEGLGLARPDKVILADPDYTAALNAVFATYSVEELKDYLVYRLVIRFASLLQTDFEAPGLAINRALRGSAASPTREANAVSLVKGMLAQPLGRLYVEAYFNEQQQAIGLDMILRLQAAFRERVVASDWLAEPTREAALEKIDNFYYRFAIADRWVDYSVVEVTGNLVQSVMNINRFNVGRMVASAGKPIENWPFSNPHTYPMVVNAAYNASKNGFEVTAGIAQPPTFDAEMDAPVYFCRLGAAIGHEMIHGFDSGGKSFDAQGALRNWWTDVDEARFNAEADKLVAQGNGYEPLPGLFMNGQISVKENMADVGGIALAYDALMDYLQEHPEENVPIDGLTPSQRCFIAWAQLWAEQSAEQLVKIQLEDSHPPGPYRTVAPLQHLDAFYEAFDIRPGDPMWLEPEKRVHAW